MIQLIKPLGELSLTASVIGRSSKYSRWANDIQDFVWVELENGKRLAQLLAARPELLIAATVYGGLRTPDRNSEALDYLLRNISVSAASKAIQFPNWRRLDLEYGLEQLGIGSISPTRIQNMWCSHFPEPWAIDIDSAYALTHEIFYITDFGKVPGRLPAATARYVTQWLPVWMEIYLKSGNLDIYCELAMIGACLRNGLYSKTGASCLKPIVNAIDKHGVVPGPTGGGISLLGKDTSAQRRHFIANYHTTLVGLMALALWQSKEAQIRPYSTKLNRDTQSG